MPNWLAPEFDWDEGNEEHLYERHRVEPFEVESVFRGHIHVVRRENRYVVYGQTTAGRYLFIVCVLRGNRVRPISARDMTLEERRHYAKKTHR